MQTKLSFRVTKEQKAYIEKVCCLQGISVSVYLRKLLDSQRQKLPISAEKSKEEREYRAKLIQEINRIGVNINQIVKNVNSFYYSREEKKELYALLEKVYALLKEG